MVSSEEMRLKKKKAPERRGLSFCLVTFFRAGHVRLYFEILMLPPSYGGRGYFNPIQLA
jgi:hypothetical protein